MALPPTAPAFVADDIIRPIVPSPPPKPEPKPEPEPDLETGEKPPPTAEPPFASTVDRSDWQILPRFFQEYSALCGPFTVDACSDPKGLNAMVENFWTEKYDFCKQDWAGNNAWANFLFHLIYPGNSWSARLHLLTPPPTLLLCLWRTATWWPLVEKHFQVVDYLPPLLRGVHSLTAASRRRLPHDGTYPLAGGCHSLPPWSSRLPAATTDRRPVL